MATDPSEFVSIFSPARHEKTARFPQRTEKQTRFSAPENKRGFLVFFFSPSWCFWRLGRPLAPSPVTHPPGSFSLPLIPKPAGAAGENKKLPARSSETLPLCWSKSATTRTCVKVVRLARWQDDDLSVTTATRCRPDTARPNRLDRSPASRRGVAVVDQDASPQTSHIRIASNPIGLTATSRAVHDDRSTSGLPDQEIGPRGEDQHSCTQQAEIRHSSSFFGLNGWYQCCCWSGFRLVAWNSRLC